MPNGYPEPQKDSHADDALALDVVRSLKEKAIDVESLTGEEYQRLESFDWDVEKHIGEAAVRMHGQEVDVLHVVNVTSKKMLKMGEVTYKAKFLFKCPDYLLESRGRKDDPISVEFKATRKGLFGRGEISGYVWRSTCGTKLEHRLVESLNLDTPLRDKLISSGHTNVNAWLQESDYIAINTSKSYTQVGEIEESLNIANIIARRLKSFG